MRLGTHIRLSDGREGTVVYNSLIGVGIKWGLHNPDPSDFEGTTGNTVQEEPRENWPWEPDALLREPSSVFERFGMECVGQEFEVITED
jgi:hypothetical protein